MSAAAHALGDLGVHLAKRLEGHIVCQLHQSQLGRAT